MHAPIAKIVAFGLFISVPLASAYAIPAQSQDLTKKDEAGILSMVRNAFSLDTRHHTEAQIAAKNAKTAKTGRDVEILETRHHTEAQIAAKKAKAAKAANNGRDLTRDEIAAKAKAKAANAGRDVEAREPHHTEAQIAAKKAANAGHHVEKREAHHTEAQIAAKKAKEAKEGSA